MSIIRAVLVVASFSLFCSGALAQTQAANECATLSGDAAIVACSRAIAENPKDANSYRYRGLAWEQKGNLPNALADAERALQLDPLYTRARADVERIKERLKAALPLIEAAPVAVDGNGKKLQ